MEKILSDTEWIEFYLNNSEFLSTYTRLSHQPKLPQNNEALPFRHLSAMSE